MYMSKPECADLSDRLLMLMEAFKDAYDSGVGMDHQQSRTFYAMLDESYQDAVLLEATAKLKVPNPAPFKGPTVGNVVHLRYRMRPASDDGGAA